MNLRHLTIALLAFIVAGTALVACDENSTVGESLVEDKIAVTIDSSFTISARSVADRSVPARTLSQLFGRIDVEGYGHLSSDVVTQFMPASTLDTAGVTVNDIDSLKLILNIAAGDFIGDSIAPMGLEVYRLDKLLPSPIYSDFDPKGYYDASQPIGSTIFNLSTLGMPDSLAAIYKGDKTVAIDLPVSLGKEMFSAYMADQQLFATPTAFTDKVFKGLYIRNSFGSGRLTRVSQTMINMYYHKKTVNDAGRDTVVDMTGYYFAVTPEIITNNIIDYNIAPAISRRIADGEDLVVAPAGYNVEINFPGREIVAAYHAGKGDLSVINTLSFTLPVEELEGHEGLVPPPYLLMVKTSEKDQFFAQSKLPDNKTSFYATYDSTGKRYVFSNMRQYILDLVEAKEISDEDTAFTLCAINVTTEQSNSYYNPTPTVTGITPYVAGPVAVKFLTDKAKIYFTYSTQKLNI